MKNLLILCLLAISVAGFSQENLQVDTFLNPTELISKVLLDNNANLGLSNVSYSGGPLQMGRFRNFMSKRFPESGIILSTGNVFDAIGPNKRGNTSNDNKGETDFELARMANNMSFDALSLSFEFSPNSDSIRFNFIFASEEYPEYVFRGVNDVFAFFLIDLETGKKQNLALVPGTNLPVSIDNINARRNPKYYIQNKYWTHHDWKYWQEHKEEAEFSFLMEFDGFTDIMEAHAAVVAGKRYQLRIALSDIGDALYDSAVFLEAGSFTDKKSKSTAASEPEELNKLFSEYEVLQEADTAFLYLPIQFAFDSYEIEASSFPDIEKLRTYLLKQTDKKLQIIGHTDDRGALAYNQKLSEQRADAVRNALIQLGMEEERIEALGKGSTKPYSKEQTEEARALNRRVEVLIY